jgi:hypothetical protein
VQKKSDRIMVWKFDLAPVELRRMHQDPKRPTWVAFIPLEVHATDVDQEIRNQAGPEGVFKYETARGDVVYMGCSGLSQFFPSEAVTWPKDASSLQHPRAVKGSQANH